MKKFRKNRVLERITTITVSACILVVSLFSVTAYSIVSAGENIYDTKKSVSVSICNGAKTIFTKTSDDTRVKDLLREKNISLAHNQKVNYALNGLVFDKMKLVVSNYEIKTEAKTTVLNYDTSLEYSDELYKGETKIKVKGENGEKESVFENEYKDGTLVKSKMLSTMVKKEPVTCVKVVGTKEKEIKRAVSAAEKNENEAQQNIATSNNANKNTFVDHNGSTVSYKQLLTGSGTAYTAAVGAITSTGVPAYVGGVAVNPNIIPYGSKLYIVSKDGSYVYGYATAVDTGGALMSGDALVDLYYESYDECIQFGRRDVLVYVL